jgi:GTPase Era involved in 16S rRNA processing
MLCSAHTTKRFVFAGETGAGKSTLINEVGGVSAPTGDFDSVTANTTMYPVTSSTHDFFRGSTLFDTAGTLDTTGRTDKEIMEGIESFFLRYDQSGSNTIDAFIIVMKTDKNRARFLTTANHLISSFSPSVAKSMVVVLNKPASQPQDIFDSYKRNLTRHVQGIAYQTYPDEELTIPMVTFNAISPTDVQVADLTDALSSVQKYVLKDLDEKRKAIQEIFEMIVKDPENYKTEIEKIVERENRTVTSQQYIKVPMEVTETDVAGCKFSGGIPGIFTMCIPNKIERKKVLLVDKLADTTRTEELPVEKENKKQVLKNELDHYWLLAVEKFEAKNREKYVKNMHKPN